MTHRMMRQKYGIWDWYRAYPFRATDKREIEKEIKEQLNDEFESNDAE